MHRFAANPAMALGMVLRKKCGVIMTATGETPRQKTVRNKMRGPDAARGRRVEAGGGGASLLASVDVCHRPDAARHPRIPVTSQPFSPSCGFVSFVDSILSHASPSANIRI